MSIWVFLAVLTSTLLLEYVLGVVTAIAFGRRSGGKPWWYDVAFPSPDETPLGAMKVLADRYALGEVSVDEFNERAAAQRRCATLRKSQGSVSCAWSAKRVR